MYFINFFFKQEFPAILKVSDFTIIQCTRLDFYFPSFLSPISPIKCCIMQGIMSLLQTQPNYEDLIFPFTDIQ